MHPLFGQGATEPYVKGEAMTLAQIEEVTEQFVQAAKNAIAAGFDGIEIHGSFTSPHHLSRGCDDRKPI